MSNVAKATIGLMIVTMLSRVLGFGREMVLSSYYATSWYVDSYVIALSVPTVIFSAIGNAISTTLIPIYSGINNEKGTDKGNEFISNIMNITIVLFMLLLIVGLVFSEEIVRIFALGLEGESFDLAVRFTKILLWGVIFTGINYILVAYLQVNGNFKVPGLISLPYSIIIIIAIILSVKLDNIYILGYGTLIAIMAQPLFQLPFAIKKGFKYKFILNLNDEDIKKFIKIIAPVLIGVSVCQLNNLVDKSISSTFAVGTIASFNYAQKLYYFVQGLFITSMVTVIYPHLSNLIASNKIDDFKKSIVESINSMLILIVPIVIGAAVLAIPIVEVLFERGEFTHSDTLVTAKILFCYVPGLIAFGISDLICRALYSLEDTKSPMINSVFVVSSNIFLNIVISKVIGYAGVAVASTVATFLGLFIYFYMLRKKIGPFGINKILMVGAKCLVSSIIMGTITILVYNKLSILLEGETIQLIISLALSILSGAISYGISIFMFKIEEINMIIDMLKAKIKIKKLDYNSKSY